MPEKNHRHAERMAEMMTAEGLPADFIAASVDIVRTYGLDALKAILNDCLIQKN